MAILERLENESYELTVKINQFKYEFTDITTVLLYGSETWLVRVEDIRRLPVFDHRGLRSIARISWDHRVSNPVARKCVLGRDSKSIEEVMELHQSTWLGHVLRMPNHRLPRRAMFYGIFFYQADSQLIDVLQEERKSLRESLLTISETIEQKQKRVDQLNQAQREAVSEMHRLKDQMHKLQQENLDNVQLKNDLSRLTRDCEILKKELSELESEQLPAVHRRWTEACDERSRITKIREENIEKATTKVNEIGEKLKKLTDACTSVKFAFDSQPLERLKVILETVEELQKNLSLVKSEADTCSQNIELLKKQINEHKMRQRELADCVQVRQLRCQLSFLTERTESLAKNQMICDNIPLSDQDLINETKRLSLEEEKLHSLKQDISNQLSELNAKLCYLNRDLNEKYTNADSEYRDMMYQLKVSISSTFFKIYKFI
ncbi:unnamed protein product [Schistosoma mattheei]|uniref:Uncharacterized protein n=1 Tax=Schistosoma mattheei TaxID=31246 RepID=A0A3P8KJJ5_9TREM|nr:unnamed protein product [Schistosoma mattheei]